MWQSRCGSLGLLLSILLRSPESRAARTSSAGLPGPAPLPRGGARYQGCSAHRSAHRSAASSPPPAAARPPPPPLFPGVGARPSLRGGRCAVAGSPLLLPGLQVPACPAPRSRRGWRLRGAAGPLRRATPPGEGGRSSRALKPPGGGWSSGARRGAARREQTAPGAPPPPGGARRRRRREEEGRDHARGDNGLGAGGGWSPGDSAPRE